MTLIAESFNWFVMSRGLFHDGPGRLPLLEDLRRQPTRFFRSWPD